MFLVTDNRVFNGPLGRSLHSAHSAHSLRCARFARSFAPFTGTLTHFAVRSLSRGTVEIPEYVFTLKTRSTGTIAFFIFTRNTPYISNSCPPCLTWKLPETFPDTYFLHSLFLCIHRHTNKCSYQYLPPDTSHGRCKIVPRTVLLYD